MNDSAKPVRVRFAPSPTGYLHLGGLRTALYNYLFAKKNNGTFILRIEDTDRARLVPDAVKNIVETLKWAGLDYDEGPDVANGMIIQKGDNGPYLQSERINRYRSYADELIGTGFAYPCFCTPERLEQMRTEQQLKKQPTGYDGTCRDMSPEAISASRAAGLTQTIRMKMPKEGITAFEDSVHGKVEFKNDLLDDQVLIKSDGFPTYHLAAVVDDHLMKITHVIRGEEWLSSTPKHLKLYEFFGWEPPQFAHLPLFLKPGGGKLSKRDMAASAFEYAEGGYLKEALLNFIALLGWHPAGEREMFSIEEMIAEFDLKDVHTSGAVFTTDKLDWLNGLYIRKMTPTLFAEEARPYLVAAGVIDEKYPVAQLQKMVVLEQQRIKKLSELPEAVSFLFKDPAVSPALLAWKKQSPAEAARALNACTVVLEAIAEADWNKANLEKKIKAAISESGEGAGETLWPLRVALSGKEASPGPFEIAEALGKEETLKRIKNAISALTTKRYDA